MTITPELVAGALTIIGMAALTLKKMGWLTIGKPVERRDCAKKCSEHEYIVANAAIATAEAKSTADTLRRDISDIKDDVKNIQTKSEEREIRMQAEFRSLREILGQLSGYVKALHEK